MVKVEIFCPYCKKPLGINHTGKAVGTVHEHFKASHPEAWKEFDEKTKHINEIIKSYLNKYGLLLGYLSPDIYGRQLYRTIGG